MKICLLSLGCKLNQSEMEGLARRLALAGHEIVRRAEEADLCILNTCTVTHIAARKSRQALRRLRRDNPGAFLVATGCYAQMSPTEIAQLQDVDMIVGNADKERLPELLASHLPGLMPSSDGPIEAGTAPLGPFAEAAFRTRAFVKIQDGCDNACTYCIVTLARGAASSRPTAEIVAEVQGRVAEGYHEVVLTGVHIGAFGRERGENLAGLVQRLLAETGVPRLRLSSVEPWDFTPELLALWPNPRLCRHLHLPLQSGCDTTLARMGRRYTTAHYREIVEAMRQAVPGIALTTDMIVGFPGETDAEFAASMAFVRQLKFARLHVFAYSRREGTVAATMPAQVPVPVKEERSAQMRRLGEEMEGAFRASFLGHTLEVLWENRVGDGAGGTPLWRGLTDNYIPVLAFSREPLANCILPAMLCALHDDGVWGTLMPQETRSCQRTSF